MGYSAACTDEQVNVKASRHCLLLRLLAANAAAVQGCLPVGGAKLCALVLFTGCLYNFTNPSSSEVMLCLFAGCACIGMCLLQGCPGPA